MAKTFDPACRTLAEHFLTAEGATPAPSLIDRLAQELQDAVEDWFAAEGDDLLESAAIAKAEAEAGPFLIEAPPIGEDWHAPNACAVVDTRRPNPDPTGEGGKGWEAAFRGTYDECNEWLEANG